MVIVTLHQFGLRLKIEFDGAWNCKICTASTNTGLGFYYEEVVLRLANLRWPKSLFPSVIYRLVSESCLRPGTGGKGRACHELGVVALYSFILKMPALTTLYETRLPPVRARSAWLKPAKELAKSHFCVMSSTYSYYFQRVFSIGRRVLARGVVTGTRLFALCFYEDCFKIRFNELRYFVLVVWK